MKPTDQWPHHAHIPGQNQRHPENAFDALRQTARPGMTVDDLARSEAFQSGLRFLHAGYFWEAHEVLEPVWMALPEGSDERHCVQGLIQLANGRLKLCMGRPKAALRLVGLARELIPSSVPSTLMGVKVQEAHRWIDALETDSRRAMDGASNRE